MKEAKETTATYTEDSEGKQLFGSTSIRREVSRYKKFSEVYPDSFKFIQNDDGSCYYEADPDEFVLKVSHKKKVSDEFKEKASQRFKDMWQEKNVKGEN